MRLRGLREMSTIREAFLSSTAEDLKQAREDVYKAIEGLDGWHCWRMEDASASDMRPDESCQAKVAECDLFVGIVGHIYGSIPQGCGHSFTEREYDTATHCSKPRLMFVAASDFRHPGALRDSDEAHAKLLAFRKRIDAELYRHEFGTETELPTKVVQAIRNWEMRQPVSPEIPEQLVPATQVDGETPHQEPRPEFSAMQRDTSTTHVEQFGSLSSATLARRLALSGPKAFSDKANAAGILLEGHAPAFWFIESIQSLDWLEALANPLKALAAGKDQNLQHAIGGLLCELAQEAPQEVMNLSLVRALWDSATFWGKLQAVNVIHAAKAWEDQQTAGLLDTLSEQDGATIQHAAYRLTEYAKSSAPALRFAFECLVRWLGITSAEVHERQQPPFGAPLNRCLHELLSAGPDLGLDYAIPMIDAHLRVADEAEIVRRLLFPMPSAPGQEGATIQVRNLLARQLHEEPSRPRVLTILHELVRSERAAKRVVAMDVAEENLELCKDVALIAIANHDDYVWPQSEWIDYLISRLFRILTEQERREAEAAVLALPDTSPVERIRGAVKVHTLEAIPSEYASCEVTATIRRLREASPQLSPARTAPESPGQTFVFGPAELVLPQFDFPELIAEPTKLVAKLRQAKEGWPEAWFDAGQALGQALTQAPNRIAAVAEALATASPPLSDTLVDGVAWAVREAAQAQTVTGDTALQVARILEPVVTAETRKALSAAISKRWDTVSGDSREPAVHLLCQWADPQVEPDPTPEEYSQEAGEATTVGLNSGRGGIAVALVDLVPQTKGDLQQLLLDRITQLAYDQSLVVRAVVLLWLGNLVGRVDREWLVKAAQGCIADFHAAVLAHAHRVLRILDIADINDFGVSVVRAMMAAGNEAAEGGGFLAAFWSLRYELAELEALVDQLIRGDTLPAKKEAARVFSYNLLAREDGIREKSGRRCEELLRDPSPEVRAAVAQGLPSGEDVDLLPALKVIEIAARDEDFDVVSGIWGAVYHHWQRPKQECPAAVAAVISGIVACTNEETRGQFLRTNAHELAAVYDLLKNNGYAQVALRLLDAACYHCILEAGEFLGDLDTEEW